MVCSLRFGRSLLPLQKYNHWSKTRVISFVWLLTAEHRGDRAKSSPLKYWHPASSGLNISIYQVLRTHRAVSRWCTAYQTRGQPLPNPPCPHNEWQHIFAKSLLHTKSPLAVEWFSLSLCIGRTPPECRGVVLVTQPESPFCLRCY